MEFDWIYKNTNLGNLGNLLKYSINFIFPYFQGTSNKQHILSIYTTSKQGRNLSI